jgi:hypothetical protein
MFVAHRVKPAAPHHAQNCLAVAAKQIGYARHRKRMALARFGFGIGIGWPKPRIKQIRQSVLEGGRLLVRFGVWQFHVKLNRRFSVDYHLAKQNPLHTHAPLIVQ